MNQATLEKRYGWKGGSDAAARYIRVFGEDADRELIEVRGMDVEIEEPDPTGPKNCKRCRVLIEQDAEKCDVCGFIQDRDKAAEEAGKITTGSVDSIIQEAVREEIGNISAGLAMEPDDPDRTAARAEMLDAFTNDEDMLADLDTIIDQKVKERLDARTG